MGWFNCCRGGVLRTLSRAAAKSAADKLRLSGALPLHPKWAERASLWERCPIRVISAGLSYCGKPLMTQLHREPTDGCGCLTHAKAKAPAEHCPLDMSNNPSVTDIDHCTCKWCTLV